MFAHTFRTERSLTRTTNDVYGEHFTQHQTEKVRIQPILRPLLQYVDENRAKFLDNLREAVAIKSITTRLQYKDDAIEAVKLTEKWLNKLGITYECFNVGKYEVDGKQIKVPPVILATCGTDPQKKTVCVYCYLDVAEPNLSKWKTNPFKLTEKDGTFYGAGTASGKGSMLCWFEVIQTFQATNTDLPVNLLFVIESMNHLKNYALENFLGMKKADCFGPIDAVVMVDSQWLGNRYPSIVYGTVGMLHFCITIEKLKISLTEIKDDMKNIFKKISNDENEVFIPTFYDGVQQVTPNEELLYENITDFDENEVRESLPPHMQDWNKRNILMHFWRHPSIWVGDIQECMCELKDFSKIKRYFILKIVPNQTVDEIIALTKKHVQNVTRKLNITNKVTCKLVHATRPWIEDYNLPIYKSARRAILQIFNEEPNYIREDKSRPILNILENVFETNLILLPLGCKSCNVGEENENISPKHYFEGIKLIAAFLLQLSDVHTYVNK